VSCFSDIGAKASSDRKQRRLLRTSLPVNTDAAITHYLAAPEDGGAPGIGDVVVGSKLIAANCTDLSKGVIGPKTAAAFAHLIAGEHRRSNNALPSCPRDGGAPAARRTNGRSRHCRQDYYVGKARISRTGETGETLGKKKLQKSAQRSGEKLGMLETRWSRRCHEALRVRLTGRE
jgi:hypothetical protein